MIALLLLASLQFAFGYTQEELGSFQARLTSIQTEINTLNSKLAGTADEKSRQELIDKIQFYQLLADDLDRKIKGGSSATSASGAGSEKAAKAAADPAKIKKDKQRLAALQTEIAKLNKRHSRAKSAAEKKKLADRILIYKSEVAAIKNRLYPKPKRKPALASPPTFEAAAAKRSTLLTLEAEDFLYYPPETKELKPSAFKRSVGVNGGFFGGATAFLGEARVPLRMVFGPALTSLRISAGLAQSRDTGTRYYPANLDLLFNFPPGWFTGTDNYIGFGLNYVVSTTMGKPGTVGGELFYGVESEGFGGTVFGEVGYAILRTGFSPSHKGGTVLVGLRKTLGQ